jgi:hypothetical protein
MEDEYSWEGIRFRDSATGVLWPGELTAKRTLVGLQQCSPSSKQTSRTAEALKQSSGAR